MTCAFLSRQGTRAAMLVAGVSAALVVSAWLAPVAGAGATPTTRAWTVQPSPDPAGALGSGLQAVSCWSPGSCVAVGSYSYPSGQQIPDQGVLAEQLSDGAWTIASTPAISGATSSSLSGVSCPAAGFCVAVGSAQFTTSPASTLPVAETWNGTSWSGAVLPVPAGGNDASLTAVSCATPGACVAVGSYSNKAGASRPLAEQLAGSTWSLLPTPTPPHGKGAYSDTEFTGVDCPAVTGCEVVGDVFYNDTLQNVFAYGLSASTWTYQHQVNPGPDPGNSDTSVSCSAPGACTSVGLVQIGGELALAEYWNGSTWVRQATPAPAHRPATGLYGVSCDGGSSCVAVGVSWRVDQQNGQLIDPRVMGEVWNGTSWSQSPPVVLSGTSADLNGISCPSPTACIAVGDTTTASSSSTLIESYTG
jgi:hypothetical protein